MCTFGPVPSRRLGQSLGINNIPPKFCTYSCVYCQVGRTNHLLKGRRVFYNPDKIFAEVQNRVEMLKEIDEKIDYLTFVSDGEPTLDTLLGREIILTRSLQIKVAVITNASLIWRPDVRDDLMQADFVSLKIDSVQEDIWKKINRPHGALKIDKIMKGMQDFTKDYQGNLVTETVLVKGLNDNDSQIHKIADFVKQLKPSVAYVAIPTRPPAEKWVQPPDEDLINKAFQIFNDKIKHVEYLIGYEGNAFAFTGNVEDDLLNITAIHPMREDAVRKLIKKANADWSFVQELINKQKLVKTKYAGNQYYIRKFSNGGCSN
ncbi:MAG: radical SAM protein [Calditrichaeota bacterium]|nr:MAG: radical SAM protein [Calditrichota bacterium]